MSNGFDLEDLAVHGYALLMYDQRGSGLSLPNSRLLLIPAAGHRTWLDQPALLFDALDTFLRGRFPRGARRGARSGDD